MHPKGAKKPFFGRNYGTGDRGGHGDVRLRDCVGRDQKQHIEYTRDTAEKFNAIFGNVFTLPKELIIESVEIVPGTDGRKMSKSVGNVISFD